MSVRSPADGLKPTDAVTMTQHDLNAYTERVREAERKTVADELRVWAEQTFYDSIRNGTTMRQFVNLIADGIDGTGRKEAEEKNRDFFDSLPIARQEPTP